ncbi:hypothetical protein KDK95_03555 [Actinospica sp. MGRD01-02]|uniref:PknH-like extracellular domain-containing protein n=1 Tax=Actinospica acidithermotolerans TaxID=2828514 RepID=A0A941IJ37_9ACTN|nr:hypothetical protein [Actinospica acidithermotolerans]MBR7825371.1 hypothetical protein [Actinospica acidithermotolerans]
MRLKRLCSIAAAAALPLAAAGCDLPGLSHASSGGPAGGSAAGAAASTSANPDAGLLTGTQLRGALVTTGIPSGYAAVAASAVDSGSSYVSPSPPSTAAPKCANLIASGWVNLAGYQSASFAQSDYVNNGKSEEFLQEIDAYQGSTAQSVMAGLAKLGTSCPTFKDANTKNSTVKVSVATAASPGAGSVTITLTDPSWASSATLIAVRVGPNVISVLNSATGDSATYAKTLASAITANLAKLG